MVQGNLVGTDVLGSYAIGPGSGSGIVSGVGDNLIGGTVAGAGNVVSGNNVGVRVGGNGNRVQGNFLGTDVSGTRAIPNNTGVGISFGRDNLIGGTEAGARNVISGNSQNGVGISDEGHGNRVQGNFIGTDITGNTALPNEQNGVSNLRGSDNLIGGTEPGAGNVISGNLENGVLFYSYSDANRVQGNIIGLNARGTQALGNRGHGVLLSSDGNLVGGTVAGAPNLISGNGRSGVRSVSTGRNRIEGNFIGPDLTGTRVLGNQGAGVDLERIGQTTVGGTAPGARNVIAGNGLAGVRIADSLGENVVQGNFIGTDVAGSHALGNGIAGPEGQGSGVILLGGLGNTIGGTTPGARNLISGHAADGVYLATGTGNVVAGNFLGTDAAGTWAVANRGHGVHFAGGSENTVGGTTAGARNLISGNRGDGIRLAGNGHSVQGNFIGTDAAGTRDLANSIGIRVNGSNHTLGGKVAGSRNLISGNVVGLWMEATSRNTVQGNYIGTDVTGTVALVNTGPAVYVYGATANLIGGTVPGAGNVIAAHSFQACITLETGATDNLIQGNKLGTDVTGTRVLGHHSGVFISNNSTDNVIGGTEAGAGNLISGGSASGIALFNGSDRTRIQGNKIGTDITGTVALANQTGIIIGTYNNLIGGADPGAGNLISGNAGHGLNVGAISNLVQGNRVGTDASGTRALPNGGIGILVTTYDNTIGGTVPGAGNLISGNTGAGIQINNSGRNIVIQGNFIGTDFSGTRALGNAIGVEIAFGPDNIIGGTMPAARNVISGNRGAGVLINSAGNLVQGNTIGTDVSGTEPLGNQGSGVQVQAGATNNTIGDTTPGAGNLISGNRGWGVSISGTGNSLQGNKIGTDVNGTFALANGVVNSMGGVLISANNNTIGGAAPGAGNLISGNHWSGVMIERASGVFVQGNFIGTDVTGTSSLGNDRAGVLLRTDAVNNTVGGVTAGTGNLLSGNTTYGVELGEGSRGNRVQGNYIGTDLTGRVAVANRFVGVGVNGSNDNLIGGTEAGAGNVISGNQAVGIQLRIFISPSLGNRIEGNLIGTDMTGTARLANGIGLQIDIACGNNTIGGAAPGAGNLISGNTELGIDIRTNVGTQPNRIQGNFIGTDITGTHELGNRAGISILGAANLIGGTESGAGNLISGNSSYGIFLPGVGGTPVQGNFIGTDVTGRLAVPNGADGVIVGDGLTMVGGTTPGAANLISGNRGHGVRLNGNDARLQGNLIGTDITGLAPLGNQGSGVYIPTQFSLNNSIGGTAPGAANLIAFNGGDGILVDGGTRNAIRRNAIFGHDAGLGIRLVNGGNNNQAAPELTTVFTGGGFTTIEGTLTSAPSTTFTIELFVNVVCHPSGFGEGERFFASLTVATDADGLASFALTVPGELELGQFVSATATDPAGNTSQFAACGEVVGSDWPNPAVALLRRAAMDMLFTSRPAPASWLLSGSDSFAASRRAEYLPHFRDGNGSLVQENSATEGIAFVVHPQFSSANRPDERAPASCWGTFPLFPDFAFSASASHGSRV